MKNHPAHAAAMLAAAHLCEALRRLEDAAADQRPPGVLVDMLVGGEFYGWCWSAEKILAGLQETAVPDPALWRRLQERLETV